MGSAGLKSSRVAILSIFFVQLLCKIIVRVVTIKISAKNCLGLLVSLRF